MKEWERKCRRGDSWNPKTSFICSNHFREDDFVRDLKSELLGYNPKIRYLKPEAIPSLNLPDDHVKTNLSESMITRKNRMNTKSEKQVNMYTIQ